MAKAHLTVTANDKTRAYGVANPPLDATITDFVNGENLGSSGVSGAAACTTAATPSSPVSGSTYAITCTVGTLAAANYDFPTFNPGALTVTQASTSTAVSSDINPSNVGQEVTFTATITGFNGGTAGGTVQFMDGVGNLGAPVGVASGQAQLATSALALGAHSITAVYSGDPNLIGSTSSALIQTVSASLSVTSVVPGSVGRGASHFALGVVGTGFVPSSAVTISGSGITVHSTSFVDATHLTADISVSSGASTATRNVTVTIPGPASATCTNCLGINFGPAVFFASPGSMGRGAVNENVSIVGLNFESGTWTPSSVLFSGGRASPSTR